MKRLIFLLTLLLPFVSLRASLCIAGDPETGYGTIIPVEWRSGNEFKRIIGKLEYTGSSIDIVSFGGGLGGMPIVILPQVYIIKEKTVRAKGVHYFLGVNQYGTTANGHVDFRDEVHPKVTFLIENGTLITNLSKEGREWYEKNIPNIDIGCIKCLFDKKD